MSKVSMRSTPSSSGDGPSRTSTKRKATTACAKCRANQKRCENGLSPVEAEQQGLSPRACDRCVKSGTQCVWDNDTDFRHVFKTRDAISMEAQIERLKQENAILKRRLEEHGISTELSAAAVHSGLEDTGEREQEGSSHVSGRRVGEIWYGGPSPFKDQEETDTGASPSSAPASSALDHIRTPSYRLCRTLAEVQSLDPETADEWLRYLPGDTASILSRVEHDRAIINFFSFFSNWQLRVLPHLFLRDFAVATSRPRSGKPPPTQHYSALTHNAILSVALAYSDSEHLRSLDVREKFAKHAKLFLEAECRAATLSTVEGLAVLSSFHSGFAEQGLGFMYFGMSVRIAQAIGLHVSADTKVVTLESRERDYVFWSLLAQDKCWSLYVGRDQGIRAPHYDVADPIPDENMDATPWVWTYDHDQGPYEQPSNLSRSFVQQVALMKIACDIMDVVYGMKSVSRRGGLNLGRVADLHLDLRSWEGKLPRTLHIADTSVKASRAPPHIMMVNLAYHWLSILLLRPLFKPGYVSAPGSAVDSGHSSLLSAETQRRDTLATLRDAAASQCPSSANQIVRLFNRYDVVYGLRFSPITAPQIAYAAGQIHLGMYFAAATPSAREKARSMVVDCINILEKMGTTWVAGRVTGAILQRLLERRDSFSPQPSAGLVSAPANKRVSTTPAPANTSTVRTRASARSTRSAQSNVSRLSASNPATISSTSDSEPMDYTPSLSHIPYASADNIPSGSTSGTPGSAHDSQSSYVGSFDPSFPLPSWLPSFVENASGADWNAANYTTALEQQLQWFGGGATNAASPDPDNVQMWTAMPLPDSMPQFADPGNIQNAFHGAPIEYQPDRDVNSLFYGGGNDGTR